MTFRSDAQYTLPGELYMDTRGASAPPDHYSPLYDCTDHSNPSHREVVASMDPHAYLWVYSIAENVFDDWLDFVDPATDEVLEEMDVVQDRLKELRAKEVLTRACAEERKHGWACIYKVYTGNRIRTPAEEGLEAFMGDAMAFSDTPMAGHRDVLQLQCLPTIDLLMASVDSQNKPRLIQYISGVPKDNAVGANAINVFFHVSRCFLINPRPKDRSWIGVTALEPIWEVLYTLRQHLDSMTVIAQKSGLGLLKVDHQGDLTSTEADRMNSALQAASKRRYLMVDPNVWTKFEYITPELAKTGLPEQIAIAYGMLAAGTGLPTTRWIGAQAGNLEGSRTNLKIEYGVISAIQASYEPVIRALVEELFPGQFLSYKVKWRMEYQMDQLEESQVLSQKAGAIQQLQGIATLEELRKKLKLPADITPEETLGAQNQERQLEATKELGRGLQAASGAKPGQGARPAAPTRQDAYQARSDGRFTQFLAYWQEQGFSTNRIRVLCGMGKHSIPKFLREESARESELQL